MWGNASDVFELTFRTQRPDALFFPGSILDEGRNALLAAAAAVELRRGRRYTYYALLDGDAEAVPTWRVALRRFEASLRRWLPAVGLPAYSGVGVARVPWSGRVAEAPWAGASPTAHVDLSLKELRPCRGVV